MAAVTSGVIAGVGGLVSIFDGIDSKKKAKEAQRQSDEALARARREFDVNRQEGVQVPLESYRQALRQTTAQQEQALSALTEADTRSLAAGVGKLQAASGDVSERQRAAMEQAIYTRDQAIAADATRIDEGMAGFSTQEATGAAAASADLNKLGTGQILSGAMGLAQSGVSIYKGQKLFKDEEAAARRKEAFKKSFKYLGGLFGAGKSAQVYPSSFQTGETSFASSLSNPLLGGKNYASEFETIGTPVYTSNLLNQ